MEWHLNKEKERQKVLMLKIESENVCVGKKLIINPFKSSFFVIQPASQDECSDEYRDVRSTIDSPL